MGNKVSVFPGTTPRYRRIATANIAAAGDRLIIDIAKENIQKELALVFNLSMANVGAPTAINLNRLGKIVSGIVMRVAGPQNGELINCSGLTAHLLSSTSEEAPAAIAPLAAPQVTQFAIDLHLSNEALRNLATAINGDEATGITLEITMGALADFRSIAGGPFTAAAAFTTCTGTVEVVVNESAPRELAGVQGVAQARHFIRDAFAAFAGAGTTQIQLQVGNSCRGLLISAEVAATAVGSDAVISNISLQIGGETILDESWFAARLATARITRINETGIVWIPFSEEDESGFLNLYNTNQAFLNFTTTGAGQVRVLQDYSQGLIA